LVWSSSLARAGDYYIGSFLFSSAAPVGVWNLVCQANDGSSIDVSTVNIALASTTQEGRSWQDYLLSLNETLRSLNVTGGGGGE